MLAATHEVGDGARVRLRLARPSDLARIEAVVDSDERARELAFYDPRARLTVAATRPGPDGESIVGLAAVELGDEETEVVVADDEHGTGLDGLLAQAAVALATQRNAA
jgi:hypothetical protein